MHHITNSGVGVTSVFFLEFRFRVGVVIGLGGVKFEARRTKWRGPKDREQWWDPRAASQLQGLRECCKLPQWGPRVLFGLKMVPGGDNPGTKIFRLHFKKWLYSHHHSQKWW